MTVAAVVSASTTSVTTMTRRTVRRGSGSVAVAVMGEESQTG